MPYSLLRAVLSLPITDAPIVDVPIHYNFFSCKRQKSNSNLLAYVEKGTYVLRDRKVKGFRHGLIQILKGCQEYVSLPILILQLSACADSSQLFLCGDKIVTTSADLIAYQLTNPQWKEGSFS